MESRSARIYFWIGLFVALGALGLPLIGVAVNVWLGGAVLAIAFYCIVRAFWIWERSSTWHVLLRIGTIAIAAVIYFLMVGRQMVAEWHKEHPIVAVKSPEPVPPTSPAPAPKEPPAKKLPQTKREPQGQQQSGKENIQTGPVTQGPCGNVQIGGSGNQATTNCGPQVRFPQQQMDALAKLLSAQRGGVSISTENADSTTLQDATNLLTAFAKARTWTTQGVNTSIHPPDIGADGLPIPIPKGVHISARSEKSVVAEFVKAAIKQVTGVEAHVATDETLTNFDVSILVGVPE